MFLAELMVGNADLLNLLQVEWDRFAIEWQASHVEYGLGHGPRKVSVDFREEFRQVGSDVLVLVVEQRRDHLVDEVERHGHARWAAHVRPAQGCQPNDTNIHIRMWDKSATWNRIHHILYNNTNKLEPLKNCENN